MGSPKDDATTRDVALPHAASPPVQDASEGTGRRPRGSLVWVLAGLGVYLAIACLAYWPVGPLDGTQIVGCACSDRIQEVWFFSWVFHALSHGINPFTTSAINYPYGVNLVDNTSMPLLGVLASPFTAIFGPIAAFGLFMRLAFFASAASMMFVLRRYTRWFPAAFLGGLLYGFSPYVVDTAVGHLFVAFVPIPPLIILVLDELLRRQERSARRYGVILGLLLAAQFFISIEVLVTTAICAVIGILFAAWISRSTVRRRLPYALEGAKWALGTLVVLVGYPLYVYFRGPWHVTGPQHKLADIAKLRVDLLGAIIPTISQYFAPPHLAAIATGYVDGDIAENGSYLGIPLVLLLAYFCFRLRRDRFIASVAFMGAAAFVLSLGVSLNIGGHLTPIPLPFKIISKFPVVNNLIASRFSLYVALAAAFVFAIGLDRWKRGVGAPPGGGRSRAHRRAGRAATAGRRVPVTGLVVLVGAGVLVPLVPQVPLRTQAAHVPAYFTSAAVKAIPEGSVVLPYPYDISAVNYGMLWQAESGFRFRLVGGEASKPPPTAPGATRADPLPPNLVLDLFLVAYKGLPRDLAPGYNSKRMAGVRNYFKRWHIGTIICYPVGADPGLVVHYLTFALGRAPERFGPIDIWYNAETDDGWRPQKARPS